LYAEGALLLQVKDRIEGELREDFATLKVSALSEAASAGEKVIAKAAGGAP
jgi:hypothetical protein